MEPVVWIVIPALILAILLVYAFNVLARMRNVVKTAWADIDVQLKRRAELVPNLVETARGYSGFERQTLESVTAARARAADSNLSPHDRAEVEGQLATRLTQMMVLVENYPELKASAHFMRLQEELTVTEGRIASARQYYNAAVRDYNTMLDSFPLGIVGAAFGHKRSEFFEVDRPDDREAPSARITP